MLRTYETNIAQKYGIEETMLFSIIATIIRKCELDENFYDERYWSALSTNELLEILPELRSERKIRRLITKLIEQGLILEKTFTPSVTQNTHWYALTDTGLKTYLRYHLFLYY